MKTKLIFLALWCAITCTVVWGAETATTLMPPTSPVPAGGTARFDLVSLNPGSFEIPFAAPAVLSGRVETERGSWPVTLEGAAPVPVAVAPGAFAARRYSVVLPETLVGQATLTVTPPHSAPLHAVFTVAATESPSAAQPQTPLAKMTATASVSSTLARSFAGRFLPNQPIYFLYGSGAEQAVKYQFSFDYRLATLHLGKGERSPTSSVRIGYTQRSLWDIEADSSPFYDTSYMPEVAFVTESRLPAERSSWYTWMGLRAGYQHESNGRDGDDSRSMNRAYFRARFILGSLDSWYAVMLPEVHAYVGGLEANPRIKDYRGYGRLQFYLGHRDHLTLRVNAWAGKDFDHPSYQLDLTYPLKLRWVELESYLQVQYFNGYGESLRAYDRKTDAVRFGLALVR